MTIRPSRPLLGEEGWINPHEVMRVVWEGRWRIALVATALGVAATVYALLAPKIYRAEALVLPREQLGQAGGLVVPGELSGISSVAGISFGANTDKAVILATLKSRALIEPFLVDFGLLPKLYPSAWDKEAGRWKEDDPEKQPDLWQGYLDFIRQVLNVTEDKRTGLVTVAVNWGDPEEAQHLVTDLVRRTNTYLQEKAVQEGERNLSYLRAQSDKVGQVEVQRAIFNLVESELKKVMVARGAEEYALRTIDRAVVPKKRIWPKRKLIVLAGIVIGILAGVMLVLVTDIIQRSRSTPGPLTT